MHEVFDWKKELSDTIISNFFFLRFNRRDTDKNRSSRMRLTYQIPFF